MISTFREERKSKTTHRSEMFHRKASSIVHAILPVPHPLRRLGIHSDNGKGESVPTEKHEKGRGRTHRYRIGRSWSLSRLWTIGAMGCSESRDVRGIEEKRREEETHKSQGWCGSVQT
jgi:ribosomal protein L4